MRRLIPWTLAAVAAALALFLAPGGTRPAVACSFAPFHTAFMADTIENSEVIAVGALGAPVGDAITLSVEEGFKGVAAGTDITINNAQNLDCFEELETGRQNYPEGERVLAFLIPDTHGVAQYKVHRFGWDLFRIEGDELHPTVNTWLRPVARVDDVREHFAEIVTDEFDPGIELIPPCNPPAGNWEATDVGTWQRMAEAILIGTIVGEREGNTAVRVDESFKGDLPGEVTLNDHWFHQDDGCQLMMEEGRGSPAAGTRVAMLLVRDEFGVADWRPAVWGRATWEVNDTDLVRYPGIPLLSEVRDAVPQDGISTVPGGAITPVELDQPDPEQAIEEADPGSEPRAWMTVVAIVLMIVAVMAVGASFIARRRA